MELRDSVEIEQRTRYGIFRVFVWPGVRGSEPVAFVTPNLDVSESVLVRVHSECLFGDTFGTMHCDCSAQKDAALRRIASSGNGVFVYDRAEGRGVGLLAKASAIRLQQTDELDTFESNRRLGLPEDARDYRVAAAVLRCLGVVRMRLLTNNLEKLHAVAKHANIVADREPLEIRSSADNALYLRAKKGRGHLLTEALI